MAMDMVSRAIALWGNIHRACTASKWGQQNDYTTCVFSPAACTKKKCCFSWTCHISIWHRLRKEHEQSLVVGLMCCNMLHQERWSGWWQWTCVSAVDSETCVFFVSGSSWNSSQQDVCCCVWDCSTRWSKCGQPLMWRNWRDLGNYIISVFTLLLATYFWQRHPWSLPFAMRLSEL